MQTAPAILEMQNVTKVYGSGDTAVTALDSVNFRANAGEVVRSAEATSVAGMRPVMVPSACRTAVCTLEAYCWTNCSENAEELRCQE